MKKPPTKGASEGAKLRRALADDLRRKDTARLAELAAALERARRAKREAVLGVRSLCRSERARLAARAAELRAEVHAVAEERRAVREGCKAGREGTRDAGLRVVAEAKRRAREEREHQRSVRRFERPAKAGPSLARGVAGGRRSAEARSESDDEVRGNIDPALVPLWERIKSTVRATARQSRTDAFLHWVHDHPEAQYEAAEEAAAEELRRIEREHAAHARAMKHPRRYRRSAAELAAAVPF